MYDIDCSRCSRRDAATEELEHVFKSMPAQDDPGPRVWLPLFVLAMLCLAVWCGYAWYSELAATIAGVAGA